jgi:transcriptional regulator with XRE-family HTH domain
MASLITQKIRDLMASNIKRIREKRGLTQVQAAEKAEIDPRYYPRIERGEINITLETLYKIVKALKVKASDILPF